MGYTGRAPSPAPLTSGDINDGIIETADLANGAVTALKLADTLDLSSKTMTLPDGVALPSQTGNSGKYLTTDGSDASWVALSSEALTKSFTMASGGSVTAGKVVSLNASGEVGEYPTVNTYGTTRGSAATQSYSSVSTNGSRAVTYERTVNDYRSTIVITGYAITDSGTAVAGGTTLTTTVEISSSLTSGLENYLEFYPLTSTHFLVAHGKKGYIGTTGSGYLDNTLISIDSSGNVTEVTTYNFGIEAGGAYFNGVNSWEIANLFNGSFIFNGYCRGGTTLVYRTFTVNTTAGTITGADDAEASDWSAIPLFGLLLNSGALLVKGNGNTLYTAPYSTNNIGTQSTSSAGLTGYSSGGTWYYISNSQAIIHYQKTDLDWVIANVSINQTTGAITVEDTAIWFSSTAPTNIISANGTDFVGMQAGVAFTFQIDVSGDFVKNADGSIKLGATPNVPNYYSDIFIGFNSTDVAWFNYTNLDGDAVMSPLTINAYNTDSFVIGGVSTETTSGASATVAVAGIVGGLSGLSINSNYYVDMATYDGSVTTDSTGALVGKAVSATELRLNFD